MWSIDAVRIASGSLGVVGGTDGVSEPNALNETYTYDPWGNAQRQGSYNFLLPSSPASNNRISASGFIYNPSGELTNANFGVAETFAYNSLGKLTNYDNGAATYTYDALGQRVRVDSAGTWTEYIYFNGQAISEKNADGTWSDYIFAGSRRIARADSYDQRIHISGTSTASGSYAAWYLPFTGYTIKAGDKISWRQYQTAAKGGIGISFTDSSNTNWSTHDTDGEVMNSDSTEGTWHNRTVDLSAFAGKTVNNLFVVADSGTPVGAWNIYYGEIAIYSADGTVTTIYDRAPGESFSYFSGGGETGTNAIVSRSSTANDAKSPEVSTTYYLGDQVGSTEMTLAAGGWPVAQDTIYPYGMEPSPSVSPNRYRYAGMERDRTSGLDPR